MWWIPPALCAAEAKARGSWVSNATDNSGMQKLCFLVALALVTASCSPALDWREMRSPGIEASGVALQVFMPCKPDHAKRALPASASLPSAVSPSVPPSEFHLSACQASGMNFSFGSAQYANADGARAARLALRQSLAGNLGGKVTDLKPFTVAGESASGERFSTAGKLGDGRAVVLDALVFHSGKAVFQAVVSAPADKRNAAAVDEFFNSLRVK